MARILYFLIIYVSCLMGRVDAGLLDQLGGGNFSKVLGGGNNPLGGLLGGNKSKKNQENSDHNAGDDSGNDDSSSKENDANQDDQNQKKSKGLLGGLGGGGLKNLLGGGNGGNPFASLLGGQSDDNKNAKDQGGGAESDDDSGKVAGGLTKASEGFLSKLGGGFGKGNPFAAVVSEEKKAESSDEDTPDEEGNGRKVEGDVLKKEKELFSGMGGENNPIADLLSGKGEKSANLFGQAKDLVKDGKPNLKALKGAIGGGLFGGKNEKKETKTYNFSDSTEETVDEREQRKQEMLHEVTDPSELKKKREGDVFYVSLSLVHPGLVKFPMEAFNRWYATQKFGRTSLSYNGGRSARDTNIPFKVAMAPEHQYLVYIDNYFEILKDRKMGAQAIPVRIVKDCSNFYDDDYFWKTLAEEDLVYISGETDDEDDDDFDAKPLNSFDDIKDDTLLSNLDKFIPEIRYYRGTPHYRIYGYCDFPAAIRIEPYTSPFILHKIAAAIGKRIEKDDDDRLDERNFQEEVQKIPDLTHLADTANATLDQEGANRLRQIVYSAWDQGDYMSNRTLRDGLKLLETQKRFEDINYNLLSGMEKQILVQRVGS